MGCSGKKAGCISELMVNGFSSKLIINLVHYQPFKYKSTIT